MTITQKIHGLTRHVRDLTDRLPMVQAIRQRRLGWKCAHSRKVFCIGMNKTGTTSMAEIFRQLGLIVAPQRPAELLINDWAEGEFTALLHFVKYKGQAFQDIPFSLPGTYKVLDQNFSGSKFILTVRDSAEEWYASLTRFHARLFGDGQIPTREQLERAAYIYPGWTWMAHQLIYHTPAEDPYQKESLLEFYEAHNRAVRDYFRGKPGSLLEVNLKHPNAAREISNFLSTGKIIESIPHENRS